MSPKGTGPSSPEQMPVSEAVQLLQQKGKPPGDRRQDCRRRALSTVHVGALRWPGLWVGDEPLPLHQQALCLHIPRETLPEKQLRSPGLHDF